MLLLLKTKHYRQCLPMVKCNIPLELDAKAVNNAANELIIGGIVAYPTEAVWGLGCDPFSQTAVHKILQLKNRPESKGLILVAANMDQISALLSGLSEDQIQTLTDSWPGPNTWVIEDSNEIYPAWVKGEHSSIAVRVTDHPLVMALCEAFGGPLVSTSANPSGMSSAVTEEQSVSYFGNTVDLYLSGATGGYTNPSNICVLDSGKLLR